MSASIFTSWLNIVVLAVFFVAAYIFGALFLRMPITRLREAANMQFNLSSAAVEIERGRSLLDLAQDKIQWVFGAGVVAVVLAYLLGTELALELLFPLPISSPFWVASAAGGLIVSAVVASSAATRARYALGAADAARNKIIGSISEDQVGEVAVSEHARAERDEQRFRENLGKPYEIKYLELHEAAIFRDLAWNFEPGMNLLLGRNGYGKSFLLRLLVGLLTYNNDRLRALMPDASKDARMTLRLLQGETEESIERSALKFENSVGKIPVLAIPDSRFVNRTRPSFSVDEAEDYADLARHGAHHFLHDTPYDATIQTMLVQMCIDVLVRGSHRGRPESPQLTLICEVLRELSGEQFSFKSIEPVGNAKFVILVETDASPGRPITLQQASQGTLSVIAIVALIYQFLRAAHKSASESELCTQRAIVVIDEVDAHLHPAWQRKVVPLLRERFPNVQFILTAHSPLLVAGCGRGEVSVLRREDSALVVTEFQQDFVGVGPEEIYRNVFQIEGDDHTFLDLHAQVPRLAQLKRDLDALKSKTSPDGLNIASLDQRIKAIERTRNDNDKMLAFEALERENEQLKRQLRASRAPSGSSRA